MDRFKFRAWLPQTGCFSYKVKVHEDGSYAAYIETCDGYPVRFYGSDVVLMQCTGLRDKNGVLIFEGDIVKMRTNRTYLIVWHESGFNTGWKLERSSGSLTDIGKDNSFEVIGNMHQDKGMLDDC